MSDLPTRLRRFAAVVRHERRLRKVVTRSLTDWLARVEATTVDVNDESLPDLSVYPQATPTWTSRSAAIADAAAELWEDRYLEVAPNTNLDSSSDAVGPFRRESYENLQGLPDHLYTKLSELLDEGIRQGLSAPVVNEAFRDALDVNNESWNDEIDRVTRTLVISAFNGGDQAGWLNLAEARNIEVEKRWLSSHDTKVRVTHVVADEDPRNTWIPAAEPFTVGGFYTPVPGAPTLPAHEAVNCRCTALYRVGGPPALVASAEDLKRKKRKRYPWGADMADVTITVGDGGISSDTTVSDQPLPNGWRGRIAGLDMATGDERWLATPLEGVRTREYPLTLTFQHVQEGVDIPIGNVLRVWRDAGDGLLYGEGTFDLANEDGRKYAGMLRDGIINTVSISPDQVTAESRVIGPDGDLIDGDIMDYVNCDADGFCNLLDGYKSVTVFSDWRLAGLAMVSIPAYTEARITPVYDYVDPIPQAGDALVAAVELHSYRAESFQVTATGPTPLQITPDGRIFGHAATWGACHMDFPGMCLTAPPAVDGFNRFHQHSARLADGSLIAVGALTFGDGHESKGSLYASRTHYANVATIAAKVVATEDEWGVFVCGEMVPSFDMALSDVVCYAPLSGHWEPDPDLGGQLALIAVHAVVTPGFNVRSLVAAYQPDTDQHSLILTSRRARTNVRPQVDMDALVAAVETRLHDRAAKRERVAQLVEAAGLKEHKASRVADLMARISA